MVHLLIQLRECSSLYMCCFLKHNLGVPPDSSLPFCDVLAKIETQVKDQRNKGLRCSAFMQYKQAKGESFTDFFMRFRAVIGGGRFVQGH